MKQLEVEVVLEQLGIDPIAYLNWIMKQEAGESYCQHAYSWKSPHPKPERMRITDQGR